MAVSLREKSIPRIGYNPLHLQTFDLPLFSEKLINSTQPTCSVLKISSLSRPCPNAPHLDFLLLPLAVPTVLTSDWWAPTGAGTIGLPAQTHSSLSCTSSQFVVSAVKPQPQTWSRTCWWKTTERAECRYWGDKFDHNTDWNLSQREQVHKDVMTAIVGQKKTELKTVKMSVLLTVGSLICLTVVGKEYFCYFICKWGIESMILWCVCILFWGCFVCLFIYFCSRNTFSFVKSSSIIGDLFPWNQNFWFFLPNFLTCCENLGVLNYNIQ